MNVLLFLVFQDGRMCSDISIDFHEERGGFTIEQTGERFHLNIEKRYAIVILINFGNSAIINSISTIVKQLIHLQEAYIQCIPRKYIQY